MRSKVSDLLSLHESPPKRPLGGKMYMISLPVAYEICLKFGRLELLESFIIRLFMEKTTGAALCH